MKAHRLWNTLLTQYSSYFEIKGRFLLVFNTCRSTDPSLLNQSQVNEGRGRDHGMNWPGKRGILG